MEQGGITEMRQIENRDESSKLAVAVDSSHHQSLLSNDDKNARNADVETQPKVKVREHTPSTQTAPHGTKEMADPSHSQLKHEYKKLENKFDDLHKEYQASKRENREQSLELRALNQQIVQLQEQLRVRNEQIDPHKDQARKEKQERQTLIERIHQQDDTIAHREHELCQRKTLIESMTMQTREANDEKINLELIISKLARKNQELSENLTECKDDLLRLQPPGQISDSEIGAQFDSFHQHISRIVDDETEDLQRLELRFDNLISEDERVPKLFRKHLTADHVQLGRKYPDSQPLIIRYVIQSCLESIIFNNDNHLFGLDSRTTALLKEIEQGMKQLEPRRGLYRLNCCHLPTLSRYVTTVINQPADAVSIRSWRSETLKAICSMDEFRDEQRQKAYALSQDLYESLAYFLPELTRKPDGWKPFYEQVVARCIRCSMSMRLSTADYSIRSPATKHRDVAPTVFFNDIRQYNMIDILTQKMIRAEGGLKIGEDGRIGQQMLVVQPALLKVQKTGPGLIVMCKPTLLVKLDEPLARKSRAIKAISSWFAGDQLE